MNHHTSDMSLHRTARIAGILYSLMMPFGVFGILYVPASILVEGDPVATISHVLDHTGLFRLSIISSLIVQIISIFVVLLLYELLQSIHKKMASLMVIFMFVSIPISMINELNNFAALHLITNPMILDISANQMRDMVMLFFTLHDYGITISGIFWGLWLFPMGYLIYRSKFLPKFIGILLIVACCGYVVNNLLSLANPDYGNTTIASIIEISAFGEIVFPLWLLFRGIKPSPDTA